MTPITDAKPIKRVFKIDRAVAPECGFALYDTTGLCIRVDAKPRPLADYALDSGLADEVFHAYDQTLGIGP